MKEIYHFRVEDDGYDFVDRLVDRAVAAAGLQVLLDAALSSGETVTIIEP